MFVDKRIEEHIQTYLNENNKELAKEFRVLVDQYKRFNHHADSDIIEKACRKRHNITRNNNSISETEKKARCKELCWMLDTIKNARHELKVNTQKTQNKAVRQNQFQHERKPKISDQKAPNIIITAHGKVTTI